MECPSLLLHLPGTLERTAAMVHENIREIRIDPIVPTRSVLISTARGKNGCTRRTRLSPGMSGHMWPPVNCARWCCKSELCRSQPSTTGVPEGIASIFLSNCGISRQGLVFLFRRFSWVEPGGNRLQAGGLHPCCSGRWSRGRRCSLRMASLQKGHDQPDSG